MARDEGLSGQRPGGWRRWVDKLADATVALSYGAPGYHLRQAAFEDDAGAAQDKTVVITGANAGLGLASAKALSSRGARVVMVCRNEARGERARAEVAALASGPPPKLLLADLAEPEPVERLAEDLLRLDRLDAIILNAGVLLDERRHNGQGLELTFATNTLSGFLLLRRLEPGLVERARPEGGAVRVVHVTSGGMYTQRLHLKVLQGQTERFDGVVAYAQTKRAQVILNQQWAARWQGRGVVSHAMHPGWADTPGVEQSLPRFHKLMRPLLRSPAQGADTAVWLACTSSPAVTAHGGLLWLDRAPRREHVGRRTEETPAEREALWDLCASLTGGPLPPVA